MASGDSNSARARLHTHSGQLSLSIALDEQHVIQTAKTILQQRLSRLSEPLTSPEQVQDYLVMQLVPLEREGFGCLFLDNAHRLIAFEILFHGTVNAATVYPREIVKRALQLNAAAVICAHNHPSDDIAPSTADQQMTQQVKHALQVVGIRLLDHVIVTSKHLFSLAQAGMME